MNNSTSAPGPGLRRQRGVRLFSRVAGLVLGPLGVLLVVIGFYRFATFDNSGFESGGSDGFVMFAAGGLMAVVGFGLLGAGFMGASARYSAGETMPVVKDSAAYLTDGQGVLGVGRTVDDAAPSQPAASTATGPYCRSCGTRNDEDATFCDGCGESLT